MIQPVILWVDLTQCERNPGLRSFGTLPWRICRVFGVQDLGELIRSVQPHALCFEFDYPYPLGLAMLSETKRGYPSIPILMLTKPHSEALAVWALRARVWDYFVKPVPEAEIWRSIMPLFEEEGYKDHRERVPRSFITPEHNALDCPRQPGLSHAERAILKARAYIESHLEGKISERTVAQLCALSTSCFSRTFKRVSDMTFREFVLQARINRAMELLQDKHATVTRVGYEVGFQNLSYFSVTFRRHVGMSPTIYRNQLCYIHRAGGTLGNRKVLQTTPLSCSDQSTLARCRTVTTRHIGASKITTEVSKEP